MTIYKTKKIIQCNLATKNDWQKEYLKLELAIKIVDSMHDAINHINKYSSGHSESILTQNKINVDTFFKLVDSAVLYHNASTRFSDGHEFGLGSEIGISTQKLHVRGPFGLEALNTTKYEISGNYSIKK